MSPDLIKELRSMKIFTYIYIYNDHLWWLKWSCISLSKSSNIWQYQVASLRLNICRNSQIGKSCSVILIKICKIYYLEDQMLNFQVSILYDIQPLLNQVFNICWYLFRGAIYLHLHTNCSVKWIQLLHTYYKILCLRSVARRLLFWSTKNSNRQG